MKWLAFPLSLFVALVILAVASPPAHEVDADLIKPGMTKEEVDQIIPEQHTSMVGGAIRYATTYKESGIVVGWYWNGKTSIVTHVIKIEPRPRSYLLNLFD